MSCNDNEKLKIIFVLNPLQTHDNLLLLFQSPGHWLKMMTGSVTGKQPYQVDIRHWLNTNIKTHAHMGGLGKDRGGGDGGWNLLWGGDEEIRDVLVCWWHLFRRGFPKGSMGFEMKRLQSSVDSYLRKTLNIHSRLPVVPWKKKIHLQAEMYHSKQITPTCLEAPDWK